MAKIKIKKKADIEKKNKKEMDLRKKVKELEKRIVQLESKPE